MSVETSSANNSKNVHLLVLIHGMWGKPSHLFELRRIMLEVRGQRESTKGPAGESLHILVAETNRGDATYDGIDWGAERVTEEIFAEVQSLEKIGKKVTRFSATGYSLGGLIARYVVGILSHQGFFNNVTPVNFNTIATPHIGLPRKSTVISFLTAFFGSRLLSRTGEQFFLVDNWSNTGKPLLEVMADPKRIFYQTLAQFQHVRIYANTVNDHAVPYVTAAIEEEDIFVKYTINGLHIELDDQYAPIIKSYTILQPSTSVPTPRIFSRRWMVSVLKPSRPLLPPALHFKFPYNILLLIATPILLPVIFIAVFIRFSLATCLSRYRIRRLDKAKSPQERLMHAIGRLEQEMESVVVDVFNKPGVSEVESSTTRPTIANANDIPGSGSQQEQLKNDIALSDIQRKLVASLNSLPGLKKELVFIHPVRNSHEIIISRDAQRSSSHKQGEGVIRHWVDHFIV